MVTQQDILGIAEVPMQPAAIVTKMLVHMAADGFRMPEIETFREHRLREREEMLREIKELMSTSGVTAEQMLAPILTRDTHAWWKHAIRMLAMIKDSDNSTSGDNGCRAFPTESEVPPTIGRADPRQ
jgi:hypothetical protein